MESSWKVWAGSGRHVGGVGGSVAWGQVWAGSGGVFGGVSVA